MTHSESGDGHECRSDGVFAIESTANIRVPDALAQMQREATTTTIGLGAYRSRAIVWGSGPPLIFVHGLSEIANSFALMMSQLSGHFTCVAYNLPRGDGDQAKWSRIRHSDLARDLVRVADHFQFQFPSVLASSFGSTIAVRAMAERPARFARAVFLGGFVRRKLSVAERLVCLFGRYFRGRMRDLRIRTSLNSRADQRSLEGESEAWLFMRENCGSAPIATVARQALMIANLDLRPLLPLIRQPVLLIRGDQDRLVPIEYEKDLLDGIRNVERVEIVDCGHVPQYSHPVLAAELARRFLTGSVGCPG